MTPLTPEEEQALRIALQIVYEVEQGGHRAGKISAIDEQLARALLYLKLIRHQRMELLIADLITDSEYSELAQEHSAVKRLEDYDRLRAELGIARKAFTEWRDNPSDLADYELRRALARIAEPAPKEKV